MIRDMVREQPSLGWHPSLPCSLRLYNKPLAPARGLIMGQEGTETDRAQQEAQRRELGRDLPLYINFYPVNKIFECSASPDPAPIASTSTSRLVSIRGSPPAARPEDDLDLPGRSRDGHLGTTTHHPRITPTSGAQITSLPATEPPSEQLSASPLQLFSGSEDSLCQPMPSIASRIPGPIPERLLLTLPALNWAPSTLTIVAAATPLVPLLPCTT